MLAKILKELKKVLLGKNSVFVRFFGDVNSACCQETHEKHVITDGGS